MGAGIAQLACQAGARTLLYDPDPAALERGVERIAKRLKGGAPASLLEAAGSLELFADCDVVIEAAPERLEIKHDLFTRVAAIVRDDCVLATNTSSIPVTAVAAGVPGPERVVGMHFFNPPPLMRLVEVVAGEQSGEPAVARAAELGTAMDRRVIRAADVTGFLVNRCNRPFNLEALGALTERMADVETIDRILRLGGGFRMGPFELMDLVGIDVGFEVSRSFHEQSFGEPRWRPSPFMARMVASGNHGRKTGRGWYDHTDGPYKPADPPVPGAEAGGLVVISGDVAIAHELRLLGDDAGWDVRVPEDVNGEVPDLILDCGANEEEPLQGGPQALLLTEGSLAMLDGGGGSVGFHALPPLAPGALVELTRGRDSTDLAVSATERFLHSCGLHTAWVGDAPGLVLGRVVCQLVNEAAFALEQGVASAEEIDDGMVLGLNHPHGPLTWGDLIGLDHVLAVLDALAAEHSPERYRAAPLLRRLVAEGRTGLLAGEGFHRHE
ncbi:3-hydroxyadipyl-CoA dehydrogenase [Capillimicrobium parvum]|uniref:3-hydroxyadipyl-CoA dehydrogenase n=2 Tax=Capillimicrobium parvum TaxID=2884022 RepID=A0A9E6Y0E0_9ACTN|nr:3-hydroxyadipyl-CoA dehydrogenase [Capillimicrobium parvum]